MTREKDAQMLAEAYKTIKEEHDPETFNMVAHAIAAFSLIALIKLKEFIDRKIQEKQSAQTSTAKIGKQLPQNLNSDGTLDTRDQTGTFHGLSSTLKNDAARLKGQRLPTK